MSLVCLGVRGWGFGVWGVYVCLLAVVRLGVRGLGFGVCCLGFVVCVCVCVIVRAGFLYSFVFILLAFMRAMDLLSRG